MAGWQPKPSETKQNTPPTGSSGAIPPPPKKIVIEVITKERK